MHIVIKAVGVGSIKAVIMVVADEKRVATEQIHCPPIAEIVEKVNSFLLATGHTEIAGMSHHISLGQIPLPAVADVIVRDMKNFHIHLNSSINEKSYRKMLRKTYYRKSQMQSDYHSILSV